MGKASAGDSIARFAEHKRLAGPTGPAKVGKWGDIPPVCSAQLEGLLLRSGWVQDPVFSIRDAATKNLQKLAQEFGPDWAKEHIVPQVRARVSCVCV